MLIYTEKQLFVYIVLKLIVLWVGVVQLDKKKCNFLFMLNMSGENKGGSQAVHGTLSLIPIFLIFIVS